LGFNGQIRNGVDSGDCFVEKLRRRFQTERHGLRSEPNAVDSIVFGAHRGE
jgi:hypothetical protein